MIIPILVISGVLGLFSFVEPEFSYKNIFGTTYIFLTPVMQYYIYELRNKNEYYFYFNLGLSKMLLWISTSLMSLIIGMLIIIL